MNMIIRVASISDAAAINVLSHQLGYEMSVAETQEALNNVISGKNDIVYVATIDEDVVGWIHGFVVTSIVSGKYCEIGGLIVNENHRSLAIGKLLVDAIKSWCKEKGITTLKVRSNVKRTRAHRFYEREGFVVIKCQDVFQLKFVG
jgi:GNAT superfamily N-acetyltransferase